MLNVLESGTRFEGEDGWSGPTSFIARNENSHFAFLAFDITLSRAATFTFVWARCEFDGVFWKSLTIALYPTVDRMDGRHSG